MLEYGRHVGDTGGWRGITSIAILVWMSLHSDGVESLSKEGVINHHTDEWVYAFCFNNP